MFLYFKWSLESQLLQTWRIGIWSSSTWSTDWRRCRAWGIPRFTVESWYTKGHNTNHDTRRNKGTAHRAQGQLHKTREIANLWYSAASSNDQREQDEANQGQQFETTPWHAIRRVGASRMAQTSRVAECPRGAHWAWWHPCKEIQHVAHDHQNYQARFQCTRSALSMPNLVFHSSTKNVKDSKIPIYDVHNAYFI